MYLFDGTCFGVAERETGGNAPVFCFFLGCQFEDKSCLNAFGPLGDPQQGIHEWVSLLGYLGHGR